MERQENNHSRNVRRILNSKLGLIPALDWNLTQWLPVNEMRVQFFMKSKTFHGIVCISKNPIAEKNFIVGFVDFLNNEPVLEDIAEDKLLEYIDSINPSKIGYRAPKCKAEPSSTNEKQNSFF